MDNKNRIIELTRDWIELYPCWGMPYDYIFKFRELYGLDSSDVFSNAVIGTAFMTRDGRVAIYEGEEDGKYLCVVERGNFNSGGNVLYPANGILSEPPHIVSRMDIIGMWSKEDSCCLRSILEDSEERERKRNKEFNRRVSEDLASGRYSVLDIVGH